MNKLFHIFLAVADLDRSIAFYKKAFEGTEVLYEFEIDGFDITMLGLGNGVVLELLQRPYDQSDGKWQHIAFECDDIETQYQRLMDAGATIRMPLEMTTVLKGRNGYPDTHCCGVHVLGPDGEEIELCQPQPNQPWGWKQPNAIHPTK